ncbi:MAG: hypothetical protein ACLGIR_05835 [Actinomycetes bacterium]
MSAIPVAVRPARRPARRPELRLVEAGGPRVPPSAATFRRRRLGVLGGLLAIVTGLVLAIGGIADAEPTDRVGGHAVIAPGTTLWDVAVEHAPAGTDTQAYLVELRDLNGFDGGSLAPWTVVLLPAE